MKLSQHGSGLLALLLLSLVSCNRGPGGSTDSSGPGSGITDAPEPFLGVSSFAIEGSTPLVQPRWATTSEGALWFSSVENSLTELSPAGDLVGQWDLSALPGEAAFCVRYDGTEVLAGRAGNPLSLGDFDTGGPVGDWIQVTASGAGELQPVRTADGRVLVSGVVDGRVLVGALAADRTLAWQRSFEPAGLSADSRTLLESLPGGDLLLWVPPAAGASSAFFARLDAAGAVLYESELESAFGAHSPGRTLTLRGGGAWSLLEAPAGEPCEPGDRALVSISLEDGTPRLQRLLQLDHQQVVGWSSLPGGDFLLIGGHQADPLAEAELWCARLGADGDFLWQRSFPVQASSACGTDLGLYGDDEASQFSNGDLLVVGDTTLASGWDGRGRVVMRIDAATGDAIWSRVLTDSQGLLGARRAVVIDGDRVLLLGSTELRTKAPVLQPYTALLDGDGTLLEATVVATPARGTLERLARLEDGSYFGLGDYGRDGARVPLVVHLDDQGQLDWQRRIGDPAVDDLSYRVQHDGGASQILFLGTTEAVGGVPLPQVQTISPGLVNSCQTGFSTSPGRLSLTPLVLEGAETLATTSPLDLVRLATTAGVGDLVVTPLTPVVTPVEVQEVEICF